MQRKFVEQTIFVGLVCISVASLSWAGLNQEASPHAANYDTPSVLSGAAGEGDWKPNPALLNKLAPETQIGTYSLRIPLGYASIPVPANLTRHKPFGDDEIKLYYFTGKKYPDGAASLLSFHVFTADFVSNTLHFPGNPSDTKSLSERWWRIQRSVTVKHHPNAVFSREEYGQVNGMSFMRDYVQYLEVVAKKKALVKRFEYLSISMNGGIAASFYDIEPRSTFSLPIAEATVLTLHKGKIEAGVR